jgi:hypothetical protein
VKIVVDMNLSPIWVPFLTEKGFDAVHWSQIGDPRAADATIMQWACSNDHVVFTHDLGFSALLAAAAKTVRASYRFAAKMSCLTQSAQTWLASYGSMQTNFTPAPSSRLTR